MVTHHLSLLFNPDSLVCEIYSLLGNLHDIMLNQSIGEVISKAYALEYGTDCFEMHIRAVKAGERALIIDDLVTTVGTLCSNKT